jgi:hypothetical protein
MSTETTPTEAELVRDSDDFRAGVAYAAHCLRHAVNLAHGHSGFIPPQLVLNACCLQAVFAFADGTALGLEDRNGVFPDHVHAGESL